MIFVAIFVTMILTWPYTQTTPTTWTVQAGGKGSHCKGSPSWFMTKWKTPILLRLWWENRPCCDLEPSLKVGLTIAAASLGSWVRARPVPGDDVEDYDDYDDDDDYNYDDDDDDDDSGDDDLLGHDPSSTSDKVLPRMGHHTPRLKGRPGFDQIQIIKIIADWVANPKLLHWQCSNNWLSMTKRMSCSNDN